MSLLEQFLLGLYLGIVTGILPGLVAWTLGFVFRYFTRVTVPALGVMVLAVALAGVQGGLLGLLDVEGITSVVALLVVMMVSMYCHSQGDKMGAEFPRRVSLRSIRERTLSSDVIDRVGRFGQVRVSVVGEVVEMEGYAPLSNGIKTRIKEGDWTFPANLSLDEIERRFAEALVDEFGLADVSVSVDPDGNARVVAAPPMGGLSKRVPRGKRAVSVDVLVPTGVAIGDEVDVDLGDSTVRGKVVSARSGKDETQKTAEMPEVDAAVSEVSRGASKTTGGDGRITVAVDRSDATRILEGEPRRVLVRSRGNRREYELISHLRSAGKVFEKVDIGNVADGTTVGSLDVRGSYGVIVLAIRRGGERVVAPRGDQPIKTGDSLFVVGPRPAVESFAEAVR